MTSRHAQRPDLTVEELEVKLAELSARLRRDDDDDGNEASEPAKRASGPSEDGKRLEKAFSENGNQLALPANIADRLELDASRPRPTSEANVNPPLYGGISTDINDIQASSHSLADLQSKTKFRSFGAADASKDVDKMIPSQIGSDDDSFSTSERLCAKDMRDKVHFEKHQRMIVPHGWKRGRALLAPKQTCDANDTQARTKEIVDLVAPRMIAGLLEGENVATVILSAKGERRVLFPDIKNAPLASTSSSSSLSSISFSEAQTTTAKTFLGGSAFSLRLARHFSQFNIETEPRECSRDQENGIDFFVLRAQRQCQRNNTALDTVMNHVLILEIPEESLATALHSNIPPELKLLLARESVLSSKTFGEALQALHGTQIVAVHEHLYFAALDILHEGERAPSDVDVCDADHEESQGAKAETQIALCAVDEDKIETTLSPVVASTLVHAFVSQGVDRVCARFREHAMRNIWSEISQDATARLAASGEMVRDLQQVNSALRVQRDAAIDELRGMRDELERARENALEANRAAREKALAMEDLQKNVASLNTSMSAVENDRKTMQAALKLSKEEIGSLQAELGKTKDCLAETLLECDALRNKAQDQADTLAEAQLLYLTSRSECDKYNNELRTTKAQLGHVQGQLRALKTRNLVSEEKEREAADKLRATQELLSAAQTQRQAAQKELAQAMEKLAKMRTKHAKIPMRVETKQQEVEPEIVSDDDEDASEGREFNTIAVKKNTRSDFKSPVTPRIALEDALAGLAAKARLKSPNSPFCVKQALLPTWAQDSQIVAPSLLDSPAAEIHCGAAETAYSDDETLGRQDAINTERVVADTGHSKKSNNDVEDHDSLMEERKTSEEESTPRTLGSKERLHIGSSATPGSPRCEEALEPQLECLQSQVRLFQRTSQHQKGVILEQERRIATLQAQLLAQSASNSGASDSGSLSVSVPQTSASTYSSAISAPGALRVGYPSSTLPINERRPDPSLPLSPTNQRSTKLQDDACLSPCSFEAEAMDRAHQEELARVQREHRMTLVTMDNNHRQQIKSLQGVMKKALLEAQLRREATEVSQTLQGEGSETETDCQSELEIAAKRTAELANELEIANKQTSELEDQLEACRSRLCEQRCTLDEKDTILQAKDQLLQAYASQIRMQRSVGSLPKQDLHIELLGKVASRALATACQQQCIVEALRTAKKTEEAEVLETSAMGSKNTVIAGLRCQIASQVAVIDSERRATQAALGQSDMALAEKRQAEAKLEEERKAHTATKSLLADAEACIRSQMEHMEHTAPRSILMSENARAGDKDDDGMADNDADDDDNEDEEEDDFQYSDNEDIDASSSVIRKLSSSPRSFSSRSLSGYVSPVSASPASPRSRSSLSTSQSVSPRRRPDLRVVTVDRRPPLNRTHSLSSVAGAPPRHPEPRQYFESENSPLAADGVVSAGRRGELGISRSSSMSAITARVDSAGQLGSARSTSSSMILGPALEHIERLEEAFRTQRAQIRVYHGLVDKSKHGHAREVTSMRRVAAGLHASRVAIERSFASERRNLLVRVHHLERELQETKLALKGEIDALQARADDLANKVLHADSEEVREVVQKMCSISERLRALSPGTSEIDSADAQERHAMQEQLQLLELTCERQRIKHAEALAEAHAEAEHHKDCRENLRQKYNALQPQSAFEIFDSFHVPNDIESTKRARIERILEDLRVTLASLEPYLVRDERL